jgi:cytidine deaminase
MVENCAEFNAVNNALLNGARAKDLVVKTVHTVTQEGVVPCANCSEWLLKLEIKVAR